MRDERAREMAPPPLDKLVPVHGKPQVVAACQDNHVADAPPDSCGLAATGGHRAPRPAAGAEAS